MVDPDILSRLLVPFVAGGAIGGSLLATWRFALEVGRVRRLGAAPALPPGLLASLPLAKTAALLLVPVFPEGLGAGGGPPSLPALVFLLSTGPAALAQGIVVASLLPALVRPVPLPAETVRLRARYVAKVLLLVELSSLLPFLAASAFLALSAV